MNSLFSLLVALLSLLRAAWSATLVIILTAAWFTGKSPVLTIGFSTRVTTSVGSTEAIAVAQLSAARSTWEREMVGFHIIGYFLYHTGWQGCVGNWVRYVMGYLTLHRVVFVTTHYYKA